jgi:hypothetical protein
MEPYELTRIVKFSDGRELTAKEVRSGSFVFAAHADSEPEVIFAFDREEAEQQEDRWAAERGLSEELGYVRDVVDGLPDDPSAAVDEKTERIEVTEINRRLIDLSTKDDVPAMGSPEFLQRAHDERVFDSAILYEQPRYIAPPLLGVSTSVPDLRRLRNWPTGAHSFAATGYRVIYLYLQPNYGPDRLNPAYRVYGNGRAPELPGIMSVLFC